MQWQKQGRIFKPEKYPTHPLLLTHASNPTAFHLYANVFRILFSARDSFNRSSIGCFDYDLEQRKVLEVRTQPLFTFGPSGTFFESGISIGCTFFDGSQNNIMFMGWQNPPGSHWRGDIGRLLISDDFELVLASDDPVPIVGEKDCLSYSYPWVTGDAETGFYMLYGATISWDSVNGDMIHVLKSATSSDGSHWSCGGIAIPYELGIAQAFSRPTILKGKSMSQHLWFSYRGSKAESYRIGYANKISKSADWQLNLDLNGLRPSATGWDSEMTEYPCVFSHKGRLYMLYNGNSFGKSGIGLATMKNDWL